MSAQPEVWTVQKILEWTTGHFSSKKISSARLDAELLLSRTLQCRRLDLYLRFDQPLKVDELTNFKELVKRRALREPVAYILGEKEFYGRPFSVGPGVLVPRPETEHLIDEVLRWAKDLSPERKTSLKILDVGAGSGCIGITLALELAGSHVTEVDLSATALSFTEKNAATLEIGERIETFNQGFEEFQNGKSEIFDIVASNPPYISLLEKEKLSDDVLRFEPHEALFGGERGDELLASWLPHLIRLAKPQGLIICEIGADQGKSSLKLFSDNERLKDVSLIQDYAGHARIMRAVKK